MSSRALRIMKDKPGVSKHIQDDIDGTPPGVDLEMQGKFKMINFSGHFYVMPNVPEMKFARLVHIVFASKEIIVAQDYHFKNLYVVDREKNLSLGCRMTATFTDVPQGVKL